MLNPPPPEILARLPRLYATEDVLCPEKVIHLHFFIGACDWYVAEFDGEDIFFGFANLGDPINAEWGYFKLSDLAGTEVMAPVVNAETQELGTNTGPPNPSAPSPGSAFDAHFQPIKPCGIATPGLFLFSPFKKQLLRQKSIFAYKVNGFRNTDTIFPENDSSSPPLELRGIPTARSA